jgi:MFS family permease
MDLKRVYKYLQLESFTEVELDHVFDKIRIRNTPTQQTCNDVREDDLDTDANMSTIDQSLLTDFLIHRIEELERENGLASRHDLETTASLRKEYAHEEASKLFRIFDAHAHTFQRIQKDAFTTQLLQKATKVDIKRTLPITISMLLVGSSVGIITPVMPFVVENLGLSPGQYGMVVSAFALAKMAGNVPSAILVERHGRKPYLVYSLTVIALGVGGMGLATNFEHLWACRLLTGAGVAALSTAATLAMSDISNPRNRASTMAPIMSAFAAGTALGPALGGFLADSVGITQTFYLVGFSYLGLTAVNHLLLTETKASPLLFPWQEESLPPNIQGSSISMRQAVANAVGQWAPLMADPRVRNVVIMNGFYWVALAGSQMTLLPLMLTDPTGLAMSATGVGQVYMGMSAVQVLGNPILAKVVDRLGKGRAIVVGSTLIATSMAMLPYCTDMVHLAGTLGFWATGSTMLSTAPVAYISDIVEDGKRAQAIALLRTSGDIGFLLGATGMGARADWTGDMNVAMETSAGVLLTATGWFATRQLLTKKVLPKQ